MSSLGRQIYLHTETWSNEILQYLIPKAKDTPCQKYFAASCSAGEKGNPPPQTHCTQASSAQSCL